jgi:prophage tail gpP-like protein
MIGICELLVNHRWYTGWESVSVERSLDALANGFNLTLARLPDASGIAPGAACEVRLDGETVVTGYIDQTDESMGTGGRTLSISGRDKTGDLVDCSAMLPGGKATGNVLMIAEALCAPFGITVSIAGHPVSPVGGFQVETGETVHEALKRLLKATGLTVISDGKGGVVLTRAADGHVATPLVYGRNIISMSLKRDETQVFSQYMVKGQQQAGDGVTPQQASGPLGVQANPAMRRYRPLVLTAENQTNTARAMGRAQWEQATRAAKAISIEVETVGWRTKIEQGELWPVNRLVQLDSPLAAGLFLITRVAHEQGMSGTTTRLTLAPSDAFTLGGDA